MENYIWNGDWGWGCGWWLVAGRTDEIRGVGLSVLCAAILITLIINSN